MRERIYEMINNEIKEIELNAKSEYCEELLSLINKFVKLSQKKDKKALCEMSISDLVLMALGCSNLDLYTWEEIKKDVNEIKNIIDNWNYNSTTKHFEKLYVKDASELEVPPVADLNAFSALGLTPNFTCYRMNTIYIVLERFLEFKDKIAHDSTYVSQQTNVVIKKIKAPLAPTQNAQVSLPIDFPLFNPNSYQITSAKKTMNKQEIHEEIYVETQMKGVISAYEQYYKQAVEEEKTKKAARSRTIKIYERIIEMLNDNSILNITEVPSEWDEFINSNVLCELYMIVLDNISKEYHTTEKHREELKQIINKTPLSNYLYHKGINPSSIDEEILKQLESKKIEQIIAILDFLLKIGLNITEIFTKKLHLLSEIDIQKLSNIDFLVNSNVLSKTTIINNLNILTKDTDKVQTNYEVLKTIIDFNNTYYDDRVLIIEPKVLKDMLSVLKEYNLTKNNYMYLLCNYQKLYLYDLMLENEIPLNLFISICKTPNPLNTIKRIIVYKSLGIPFEINKFNLKKDVTEETRFICNDEDLDMYIGSIVSYLVQEPFTGTRITDIVNSDLVKRIDALYMNTIDTYTFGETTISRPKVLKSLEATPELKEEDLLRVFISSSILTERNVYDIQNALQQKKLLM